MLHVFVGSDHFVRSLLPAKFAVAAKTLAEADVCIVTTTSKGDISLEALERFVASGGVLISDLDIPKATRPLAPLSSGDASSIQRYLNGALALIDEDRHRPSRKRIPELATNKPKDGISVIIPYHRDSAAREDCLKLTMLSLKQQTVRPAEVIIVGDNPTLSEEFTHIDFAQERFCKGALVNKAVFMAKHSSVIILDADIVLAPVIIQRISDALVKGAKVVHLDSNLFKLSQAATQTLLSTQDTKAIWEQAVRLHGAGTVYRTFPGGIIGITVEHFKKLGGICTGFVGWGYEDIDFLNKCEADESSFKSVGAETVVHCFHPPADKKNTSANYQLFKARSQKTIASLIAEDAKQLCAMA